MEKGCGKRRADECWRLGTERRTLTLALGEQLEMDCDAAVGSEGCRNRHAP